MLAKLLTFYHDNRGPILGVSLVFSVGLLLVALHQKQTDVVTLTAKERTWLKTHPVIRVAPDPDFPPTEFFDSNGKHSGIAADYLSLLQKKLGIRFEIVKLRDWAEVLKKARQREVDVLAAVTKTPERSEFLCFTKPYLEFPAVIITRDTFAGPLNLKNLAGKRMSVKAGYGARYYVVTNYPNIRVDVVPDINTGLRKVSFGMRDALLENLLTASYYMEKEVITNLRIAGEAEYVYRMAFAVRNDWPVLRGILDKGLDHIIADEREVIYNKWVPLNAQFLLINKRMTPPLVMGAGLLVLFVVLVFFWNRSLTRQVSLRTRELSAELNERHRIESALRESEQKFRVLAETSPVAIFLYQGERLVYVNPSVSKLTGYTKQQLLSMKFWEWANGDSQQMMKSYGLARQQGESVPEKYEAKFRTRNGKQKCIMLSVGVIQYRGAPAGLASVFDITDRKRMEEELLSANEELEKRVRERTAELAASLEQLRFTQFAVERSSDQAFWIKENGRVFYVNDSACRALGYTREELISMSVSEFDPVYDISQQEARWSTLREKKYITFESSHRAKNGRAYPVEIRANFVVFDGHEYNCCFVTDISERKRAEDTLRKSESNLRIVAAALQEKQGFLRTLLDSIPDLIFYKDTKGFYLGCNRAFEDFTGKSEKEVFGSTDFELFPLDLALFFREMDRLMFLQNGPRRNEEWVTYPDGRRVFLETLKTPNRDTDGNLLGLIGVGRDITRRKLDEEALRKAHGELELRVRERTEQLTSMTAELSRAEEHERRRIATELHDQVAQTLALSKIKLSSLLRTGSNEESPEDLAEIMDHLATAIEEIRSLTFQLSPPILHEVGLEAALEWLSDEFRDKYKLLISFRHDSRPKPLEDEMRGALYQMSRELLVNVVKHARATNVLIEVLNMPGNVAVRIADDGIGFDYTKILSNQGSPGSFGLLNIHHRIKYLGGELNIDSKPSRGTIATLVLPLSIDISESSREDFHAD